MDVCPRTIADGWVSGLWNPPPAQVQTVETYLQAKVESDLPTLQSLICAELAQRAVAESRTFATVSNVTIQNMSCRVDEDDTHVTCSGEIIAQYGNQTTPSHSHATVWYKKRAYGSGVGNLNGASRWNEFALQDSATTHPTRSASAQEIDPDYPTN
ncbi:MAG UNVERIFIED_CONTAM: hypothetical protein LVT10_10015 [Anaerolineae bacterium]